MKKIICLSFFAICFYCSNAQTNKNLIELGKNIYHFSNTSWDGGVEGNIAYTRYLKNDRIGLKFEAIVFSKVYTNEECCELGDVFDRYFFLLETSVSYAFLSSEKSKLEGHLGPVFRIGSENQVVGIYDRVTWVEIVSNEFDNTAPGLMAAASYRYLFNPKWSVKTELGVHQFFQNEGTPFNLFGGLKLGYSF